MAQFQNFSFQRNIFSRQHQLPEKYKSLIFTLYNTYLSIKTTHLKKQAKLIEFFIVSEISHIDDRMFSTSDLNCEILGNMFQRLSI